MLPRRGVCGMWAQVVQVIDTEAVPLLKRCSLAGHAELKTRNPIFGEHALAADMFIDVLTDRGFSVAHVVDEQIVPVGNSGHCGCQLACLMAAGSEYLVATHS